MYLSVYYKLGKGQRLLKMTVLCFFLWIATDLTFCSLPPLQFNTETQDELLMLLRTQQRELTELSALIETMPGTIMAQVEHLLLKHQEQERILQFLSLLFQTKGSNGSSANLVKFAFLDCPHPQTADWIEFWQRVRTTSSGFRSSSVSSSATLSARR